MSSREDVTIASNSNYFDTHPKGETHLLFIAIDDYSNGISQLNNPVSDAKAVSSILLNNYEIKEDNIECLFNKDATCEAILEAFDKYTIQITDNDNFIFFFSGHGSYHSNSGNGYWLTTESISGQRSTYFANHEVTSFISNLKARHVFGIVDSCFSESLFLTRADTPKGIRRYSFPSRWLLTAGRLEPVSDGEKGKHSPFTRALLTQLKYTEESYLWISDLCSNVIDGVVRNTENQLPRGQPLAHVGDHGGNFVLLRKGQNITQNQSTIEFDDLKKYENENAPKEMLNKESSRNNTGLNSANLENEKSLLADQLSNNEWKIVFGQLKIFLAESNRKRRLLSTLIGRYNRIIEDKIKGSESSSNISIRLNGIQSDLHQFIEDIETKDMS